MKTILSFSLVTLLAAAVVPHAQAQTQTQAVGAQQPGAANRAAARPAAVFKKLTRADFDTLLKDPTKVVVVDVRRPDEVQTIGGFPACLSIQAADLEKQLAFIPKDRTIVTVSNHAARAGRAAELLTKNGFKVAGGIGAEDYESEGGTLVKIAVPKATEAPAAAVTKTAAGQ